jgi:hypothetical protein
MKKIYAAPTIISSGTVLRETLGESGGGNESAFKPLTAGSLGFNL